MPTYDLRCSACGAGFEAFRQGFLRDEDRTCPACGERAEQVITGFVAGRSSTQMAGATTGGPAGAGGGCAHGGCGCGAH